MEAETLSELIHGFIEQLLQLLQGQAQTLTFLFPECWLIKILTPFSAMALLRHNRDDGEGKNEKRQQEDVEEDVEGDVEGDVEEVEEDVDEDVEGDVQKDVEEEGELLP